MKKETDVELTERNKNRRGHNSGVCGCCGWCVIHLFEG